MSLAKYPKTAAPAPVVGVELTPPAPVPYQVFGEQVSENGEVTLGEGGVPVPDASDVGMLGHDFPLVVSVGDSRFLARGSGTSGSFTSTTSGEPSLAAHSPTYGAIVGRARAGVKTGAAVGGHEHLSCLGKPRRSPSGPTVRFGRII